MIKINRRNSHSQMLVTAALPLGLMAAGIAPANAGSVTVTGANGAPALRDNGEAPAVQPRPRPRQATRRTPPRRSRQWRPGRPRSNVLLPPRPGRRRRRGQFDGDCVERERFSLRDSDLHRRERWAWGTNLPL